MNIIHLTLIAVLSLPIFAERQQDHHLNKNRHQDARQANIKPEVRVCHISKFDIPKEMEGTPICKNTKLGKNVALNKVLLQNVIGQSFVIGDPCSPKSLHSSDAPPAPPDANVNGVAEILQWACEGQFAGDESKTKLQDIVVDQEILNKLAYANAFYPMACTPRKIHADKY